jgi:hypothetical protein
MNIRVDDGKIFNFKIKKTNSIFKNKKIIRFVNVKTDPRLGYLRLQDTNCLLKSIIRCILGLLFSCHV